jgi:LacI family transcriptional regulator
MNRPASLTDVARVAGVSVAAASRALNGRPGVRPEIRDRVLAIAAQLRYRPHGAARDLATGAPSVIGLLLPDLDRTIPPFWAWVHRHLCGIAVEHGVGVMVSFLDDVAEHLGESFLANAWRGAVVAPDAANYRFVHELIDGGFPMVVIGAPDPRLPVPSVDVENVWSSATAVRHLLDGGAQRVGLLAGPPDRVETRLRVEGYRMALGDAGIDAEPALMIFAGYSTLAAADATARLVERDVDAIFATSDTAALAAAWTCQRLGVAVPDRVSIVGFDGLQSDFGQFADLTSVVQPVDGLTREAIRILESWPRGIRPPAEPERVVLDPALVIRSSTRRVDSL